MQNKLKAFTQLFLALRIFFHRRSSLHHSRDIDSHLARPVLLAQTAFDNNIEQFHLVSAMGVTGQIGKLWERLEGLKL